MKKITLTTAFALAVFSSGVATYGLTKFAPGAEWVIAAMGLLFEAGKLASFAMLHKTMSAMLKTALLTVGLILMGLNIVGVSGFLSNAYEKTLIRAHATTHTAQATAQSGASLIERQLAAAEANLAQAKQAVIKARDDKSRAKAAQAIVAAATAERDALVKKLGEAQASKAKVEGDAITTGGEFAAIAFLSGATGVAADTVAHLVILLIASLPDVLAVLLLVAAVRIEPAKAVETVETAKPAETAIVAPVVAEPPVDIKKVLRKAAAKRGAKTRKRNKLTKEARKLLAAHQAKPTIVGGKG